MQRDREGRAVGQVLQLGRRRFDDGLEIAQALIVGRAARPIDLVTAELVTTLQVVDFGAGKQVALNVV